MSESDRMIVELFEHLKTKLLVVNTNYDQDKEVTSQYICLFLQAQSIYSTRIITMITAEN
jgi:hypothetical protein